MGSRSRPQPSVQAALTLESLQMRSIPFLPSLLGVALLLAVSAGGVGAQTGLNGNPAKEDRAVDVQSTPRCGGLHVQADPRSAPVAFPTR
jgi:hypothetical protein